MHWTTSTLGRTGLEISPLTVGGAPLGSMPGNFGYEVEAEAGIATAVAALTGRIRAIDTSCAYSDGESERRIGEAIRRVGGVPADFVLATKITRDLATGDFSGAQLRRAIEGSLERLGVDRVPLLYLHDPENTTFAQASEPGGPLEVMRELKEAGVAGAIGVAGGDTATILEYVETDLFDVLLTHNRWTLVNRTADRLIDAAVQRRMGVINAAVLGGGILATGTAASSRYGYREAPPILLDAIRAVEGLCADAGVALPAAAVQFSVRDPRIASTVLGVSRPERIEQSIALVETSIPDDLFDAIDEAVAHLPADIGPR